MIDLRSYYPNSFDFKQMNVILKLVREKMDVDNFSRLENKKCSYFNYLPNAGPREDMNLFQTSTYKIGEHNTGLAQWLAY